MKQELKSDAYTLVELVYRRSMHGTGWSWQRLNSGLQTAVHLAINVGLNFDKGDFERFYKRFKGSYWFTDDTGGEGFYKAAIQNYHQEAIESFEAWRGRRPMVVEGERVWIGRHFKWKDQEVIVTSFKDDPVNQAIIACAYKKVTKYSNGNETYAHGDGKPIKRFTITWKDLGEVRKKTPKARRFAA